MRSRELALISIAAVVLATGGAGVHGDELSPRARATRAELADAGFERVEYAIDAARLVVWQGGKGDDLVFLHGAGDQAGAWSKVAPAFTGRYRVHLVDLPGHGESEPATGPLAFSTVLSGVKTFLHRVGGKPILVGHSMGAWLAIAHAHRNGDRVARVVAVNGGPIMAPPSGVNLMPRDREEARRTMAALRDPSSPELPDEVLDDIVRHAATGPVGRMMQQIGDMMSHLLDGRLGEVRTPVDLIWGAADQHLDLYYARRLDRELPASRLTVLERCGHLPPHECPERFLELLEQVLASDPPAPASQGAPPPPNPRPKGHRPDSGRLR